jgi:hypothetical protein
LVILKHQNIALRPKRCKFKFMILRLDNLGGVGLERSLSSSRKPE